MKAQQYHILLVILVIIHCTEGISNTWSYISKNVESNKYSSNSFKGCVLEVDLEYPKELHELYNDYPLAPDKIEIKKEMSSYQLKIAYFYNFHVGSLKKIGA